MTMLPVRLVFTLLLVTVGLAASPAAQASVPIPIPDKWGYLKLPDGAELKWSLYLPKGDGPFPTLMQYEGYSAGSDPTRALNPKFVTRMIDHGYALFGVSARGSACSTGTWDLFAKQQAQDGAYALDWAGEQKWSNGKVALVGYSYAGIMQTWIATERPKHLVALAPGNTVADTYRDISYTGGIPNVVFPPEWGFALQVDWGLASEQAVREGDSKCLTNVGTHDDPRTTLAYQQLQHPTWDDWHATHSFVTYAKNIDVPVLAVRTWQDEETGGRQAHWWDQLDPKTTWLLSSNGNHLLYQFSDDILPTLEGFFDHFLKGEDNGFEKSPHAIVWHETEPMKSAPRSITTQPTLPLKLDQAELYLGENGVLTNEPGADGETQYQYPLPAPAVADTASQGVQPYHRDNTWTHTQDSGVGRAVFTTPPLANTFTTYGPASADLWVSTSAPDADFQVTVTEVRPDGQEVYVQRGWLRASHRATDPQKSTATDPYTLDTAASLKDMPAGEPQLLRVPVFPFGQTFRPGSSLRIYVEQPSTTGLWGYQTISTPQTISILYGKSHPSRLVLGLLPNANVKPTLPGCDELLNQACRTNTIPQPDGTLTVTGASKRAPTAKPVKRPRFTLRFYGRRAAHHGGILIKLRSVGNKLTGVRVELRHAGQTVARSKPLSVSGRTRAVVLRRAGGKRFANGAYTLVARARGKVLVKRAVRLRNA